MPTQSKPPNPMQELKGKVFSALRAGNISPRDLDVRDSGLTSYTGKRILDVRFSVGWPTKKESNDANPK